MATLNYSHLFFSLMGREGGSTVICSAANADNSKSTAVTSMDTRNKKIAEIILGKTPTHPLPSPSTPNTTVNSTKWKMCAFFVFTYSLEWIIETETENRSGPVPQSDMTVKAETLTVQFGTKHPQRTQKVLLWGKSWTSFLTIYTFK